MISLDGEAINFADLFGRDDGLHELDDKEQGTRRSIRLKADLRFKISDLRILGKHGRLSGKEGDPVPAALHYSSLSGDRVPFRLTISVVSLKTPYTKSRSRPASLRPPAAAPAVRFFQDIQVKRTNGLMLPEKVEKI